MSNEAIQEDLGSATRVHLQGEPTIISDSGGLCVSRRMGEGIIIGENITVSVVRIKGDNKVQLRIHAPRDVAVNRAKVKYSEADDE